MALDPIILPDPVSVPATQAKVYDSMWIANMQIRTPHPTGPTDPLFLERPGSIYIEYYPMVSGTGELHPVSHEIRCDKLWQAVATVPEVGLALGALLGAILPLRTFSDPPPQ
jgi:hypothetical protein